MKSAQQLTTEHPRHVPKKCFWPTTPTRSDIPPSRFLIRKNLLYTTRCFWAILNLKSNIDMTLPGFISIPEQAVVGGAPVDAFQADAFRRNDVLFEQVAQSLLASPFVPNGTDGIPADADLDPRRFINAREIVVGTAKPLTARVPLIWFARERIVLNANLDGKGMGAQAGEKGDFGGSGGGGGAAGQDCVMPFSTEVILAGGAAGAPGLAVDSLGPANAWKTSRALLYLPYLKGGAAGAAGAGGGVICLCAPVIEIRGAAEIDASGADGAGGGGGGLVLLIARKFVNVRTTGGMANVKVAGGVGAAAGGNGKIIALEYK
jgi:hypothetical protein